MKQLTIDNPAVASCTVGECAYNLDNSCRARAITVGDGVHPGCDTFFMESGHVHESKRVAGIGACKVTQCRFNDDLECITEAISVGRAGSSVNCMTFAAR